MYRTQAIDLEAIPETDTQIQRGKLISAVTQTTH